MRGAQEWPRAETLMARAKVDVEHQKSRAPSSTVIRGGHRRARETAQWLQITGRRAQLDRLRGRLDPATLFQTIPGIGPELAQRIHDALGIETLEATKRQRVLNATISPTTRGDLASPLRYDKAASIVSSRFNGFR